MKGFLVIMLAFTLAVGSVTAQAPKTISLPKPVLTNDKPLMQAMADRKSGREFSDKDLSLQDIANVLWCANGVNRPDGHRTAPSAMNKQDIDVYAVTKDGIYLYDAAKHELSLVAEGDWRQAAGTQDYVASAPLNVILVSNLAKFDFTTDHAARVAMGALDAGHCSQNVYLYCSSAGLTCVTRASIDKAKFGKISKFGEDQEIMLGLTVGWGKASDGK